MLRQFQSHISNSIVVAIWKACFVITHRIGSSLSDIGSTLPNVVLHLTDLDKTYLLLHSVYSNLKELLHLATVTTVRHWSWRLWRRKQFSSKTGGGRFNLASATIGQWQMFYFGLILIAILIVIFCCCCCYYYNCYCDCFFYYENDDEDDDQGWIQEIV